MVQDELGDDVIAIRPIMNITLTYDHRLVDGALAGRFLHDLREKLQTWGEDRVLSRTLWVVRRRRGGPWDWSRDLREQDGWEEHARVMDRMVADGFILLGGPLEGDREVLHVVDAESAEAIHDPARRGQLDAERHARDRLRRPLDDPARRPQGLTSAAEDVGFASTRSEAAEGRR